MKRLIALCCLAASSCLSLHADPLLYIMNTRTGNVGYGDPPYVYQIDAATGALTNAWRNLSGLDGRGIAVIGSTMYYTALYPPSNLGINVYSYDLANNIDNGIAFTIVDINTGVALPFAQTLSSIAYDGTNFWIADDYHVLDNLHHPIFEVSPDGTVLKTILLANCLNNCQVEFFERDGVGYLIANRGYQNGPYDIYSLDGTLLTADFIDTGSPLFGNTGIAYDGKYFYTAGVYIYPDYHYLDQWDGTTGAYMREITVDRFGVGLFPSTFEDISVNYLTVSPSTATPEPSSFILLGSGLLAMAALVRHRMRPDQQR